MKLPKVSVITVVWNDAEGLERTIKSVINQAYCGNIEFIVLDGGSTDGTVDIIGNYADKIDYWVSEKDEGIYDAMNKGIDIATGTWVNFMNAGDTFANSSVLQKIDFKKNNDKVLIYGNKVQDKKIIYPLDIKKLEVGEIMACHQSMFFNKGILKNELSYDLQYRIYGDYELINRIYLKYPNNIKYINEVISNFAGGGVSSKVSFQKRKDKYLILFRHYAAIGLIRGLLYRALKVFH